MSEQASRTREQKQEEVKVAEPKKRKPRAPKDPNAPPRKRAQKDPNAKPKEPRKRKQPVVMDQSQEEPLSQEPRETTSVAAKRKRTSREEKIAKFRAKLCDRPSRFIMVIVGPSRIDSTRRRFAYWESINILTKHSDRWTDLPSNVKLNADTPCELTIFDDESSTTLDIMQAITTHAIVLRETSIEVPLFVVAEKTIVAE